MANDRLSADGNARIYVCMQLYWRMALLSSMVNEEYFLAQQPLNLAGAG
jgi:hypothetical protein